MLQLTTTAPTGPEQVLEMEKSQPIGDGLGDPDALAITKGPGMKKEELAGTL